MWHHRTTAAGACESPNLDGIFDQLVHLGDELAAIARAERSRRAARLASTVVIIASELSQVREALAELAGVPGEVRR